MLSVSSQARVRYLCLKSFTSICTFKHSLVCAWRLCKDAEHRTEQSMQMQQWHEDQDCKYHCTAQNACTVCRNAHYRYTVCCHRSRAVIAQTQSSSNISTWTTALCQREVAIGICVHLSLSPLQRSYSKQAQASQLVSAAMISGQRLEAPLLAAGTSISLLALHAS